MITTMMMTMMMTTKTINTDEKLGSSPPQPPPSSVVTSSCSSSSSNSHDHDQQQSQQQQSQIEREQQREMSLFAGLNDAAYQASLVYFEIDDSSSLSRMSTSSSCGGGPSQSVSSNGSHHPSSTSTMLDYESSSEEDRMPCLNDQMVREVLASNVELNALLQSVYVLYGNRSLLAVTARDHSPDELAHALVSTLAISHGIMLQRRPLPYTTQLTARTPSNPNSAADNLVLVGELADPQLAVVASDKSEALKIIEAKTGLRLKKIKKNVYFAGLLFQFVLLNKLMTDRVRDSTMAAVISEKANKKESNGLQNGDHQQKPQKPQHTNGLDGNGSVSIRSPSIDWTQYYLKSERRFNFRLKSIHLPTFAYDCYIFQADLTDLNCDALVNASNASLHPGYYSGDVVSRRIREKGGKQMQDSLKKILAQSKLADSDVVMTKSHGRLKSRYVLHAVAPTWSKYVLEKQSVADFEPRMEETIHNVLSKAHQTQLGLHSIGFPVASTKVGGAFDMPVSLFAHLLCTQLAQFELSADEMNLELTKVCVCSMEPDVVANMCDVFASYAEMCEQTSWALPESPMSSLVHEIFPNEFDLLLRQQKPADVQVNTISSSTYGKNGHNETLISDTSLVGDMSSILSTTIATNNDENLTLGTTTDSHESRRTIVDLARRHDDDVAETVHIISTDRMASQSIPIPSGTSEMMSRRNNESTATLTSGVVTADTSAIATTASSSSVSSSSLTTTTTMMRPRQQSNYFCVFCQREKNLLRCGNSDCSTAFCSRCYSNHLNKQSEIGSNTSSKCPGCKHPINKSLVARVDGFDPQIHQNQHHHHQQQQNPSAVSNYSFSSTSSSSSSLSISPVRFNNNNNNNNTTANIDINNTNGNIDHHHHQHHHQSALTSIPPPHTSSSITTATSGTGRRFNHSGSSNHSSSAGSVGGGSNHGASAGPSSSSSIYGGHVKFPICEGKIYIRKCDTSCDGYENFKSVMVTFEIPDGIQNNQHPKPGKPYKGTTKRAYLPDIKEHLEILAFYERALKSGMLFKLEWSRNFGDYRVFLNQDVVLKTSQQEGGRFGYPDPDYIDNLLKMARSFTGTSNS